MLGPFFSKDGSGGYGETAFFHKVSRGHFMGTSLRDTWRTAVQWFVNARKSRRFLVRQDTKTLLVTDMVVKVEDQVPEIVCEDPRPLLFHARDNALERVEDTPEVRLKGWRRIVQVGRGPCGFIPLPSNASLARVSYFRG